MYEALGQVYYDLTQYEQAIETYREIIKQYPNNIRNPEIQEAVILIAGNVEGIESALVERKNYVKLFGPGSRWADVYSRSNPQLVTEVDEKAEKYLYEYSTYFHADSMEDKYSKKEKVVILAKAVTAYEEFIATFPTSSRMSDALFNLAEIKYEQKIWGDAANLYRKLTQVLIDPTTEIFTEASWNMLLAYRMGLAKYERAHPVSEYLASLTSPSESTASVQTEPTPEDPNRSVAAKAEGRVDDSGRTVRKAATVEKRNVAVKTMDSKTAGPVGDAQQLPPAVVSMIDGSEYYIQLFPLGERTPELMYEVGTLLMRYHLWTLARTYFLRFVRRFPEDEFVLDAIKNASKTYIEEGKFEDLVKWGIEVLDSNLGKQKPIYDYFAAILSGALFKDAGRLESENAILRQTNCMLIFVQGIPIVNILTSQSECGNKLSVGYTLG